MKLRMITVACALTAIGYASALTAQTQHFKLIVNNSNSMASVSRAEVASMFLKRKTQWHNGAVIAPVDLTEDVQARQEFSSYVLNKNVSSVKSYWQQQIFSGRAVPPVEKRTDDEVIAFVKSNPNAIGYISTSTRAEGVRTIDVTD